MEKNPNEYILETINFNRFPNFLIVGVNKGGTTSVHNYCQQHPDILMSKPIKEPMFFTPPANKVPRNKQSGKLGKPIFVTDIDAYQKLFVGGASVKMRGEASTSYLASPGRAIPRIKAFKPNMKIIAILREPISRAVSAYNMYKGANLEPRSFEEIVEQEINADMHGGPYSGRRYLLLGKYASSITMYKNNFGKDRVLILNYADLIKDAEAFVTSIYSFLNVDTSFKPNMRKLNVSENWVSNNKKLSKKDLDPVIIKKLNQYFSKDLDQLKELGYRF